jgi:hypothetical protein
MPVDGPRKERFEGDIPKDLHGITPIQWYMAQAVDPQGYRHVILVVRIPNDAGPDKLMALPEDTYNQMGVLPGWLEERVRPILFPEEIEAAKSNAQKRRELGEKGRRAGKTKQLPEDNVDVM